MSVNLANLREALPLPQQFLAPVDSSEFETHAISTSMLIEERRHTRFARQTILGCTVLMLVLLAWAAVAPVREVVNGTGEILPVGLIQRVEHLEGGLVSEVLVEPGQRVEAGDLLVSLDQTSSHEELLRAEARLQSIRLTINRQQNLANGGELSAAIGGMWLRLHDSQSEALSSAEQHRDAQLDVIRADKSRIEAELASMLRQQESNAGERAIVERQLAAYDQALRTGAVSQRERDTVEREKLALQRDGAQIAGTIEALRASITEAEAREAELLARLRQEALTSVSQLEAERAEAEALVRQLADRQARQSIVAPVAGTVNVVNVRGAGDVISPADIVLEIVPSDTDVFAQVEIPAERIGGIEVGMEARLKVLTYDFTRFGDLEAVVDNVSPSSITLEDGQSVFLVDLRIVDGNGVGPGPLQPGMTVISDIVTGSKTVLQYLLKPMRVLSDRALSET